MVDIAALADPRHRDHAIATLLAKTAGGPVHLTAAAADRLMCDGTWRLIFTNGAEIIGVPPTQPKSRSTSKPWSLPATSCRFPAPACDIHLLIARHHDGPTTLDNLAHR